jgi:hypothetical protein
MNILIKDTDFETNSGFKTEFARMNRTIALQVEEQSKTVRQKCEYEADRLIEKLHALVSQELGIESKFIPFTLPPLPPHKLQAKL